MSIRIKLIPIMPRRRPFFDVPAGHAAKEIALDNLARKAEIKLSKPTENFDEPVNFTIRTVRDGVTISTNSRTYKFLNEGTRVRYALMSRDFQPKTRVGSFSSSRGRGGVIFVSRNHPLPGIEARGWTPIVQREMQAEFPREFRAVLKAYKTGEAPGL